MHASSDPCVLQNPQLTSSWQKLVKCTNYTGPHSLCNFLHLPFTSAGLVHTFSSAPCVQAPIGLTLISHPPRAEIPSS
jgi:hypothetical protein